MTISRYIPLDIDYPTNFPDGQNIPVPSGLLKDIGINPLLVLEANMRGSKQGWCWTGARVLTAEAPASLVPIKSFAGASGYRNPTTSSNLYDFSTVGLQVTGHIRDNSTLEPTVLAIPFSFSAMRKKDIRVSITGQVFSTSTLSGGLGISVGYIAWDSSGELYRKDPFDWATQGLDQTRPVVDQIFWVNPNLPDLPSIKYITPVSDETSDFRLFDLRIPYDADSSSNPPANSKGFILISIASFARAVAEGENLARETDWDWVRGVDEIDPNHIDILDKVQTYEDLFSLSSASTVGTTGAKHVGSFNRIWGTMIKVSSPVSPGEDSNPFSYHSLLQIRPSGVNGSYDPTKGRYMIHPFLPDRYLQNLERTWELPGWRVDTFAMSAIIINSVFIEETPITVDDVNLYTDDVDNYTNSATSTASRALASSYNSLVTNINNLLVSGSPATNCYNRVKGTMTVGTLCGFEVLEKNEVFPWLYYDEEETYGTQTPGLDFPVNFGSINFEGWNRGIGYICLESTSPLLEEVTGTEPYFFVDCLLDGDDQALRSRASYPLNIGFQGRRPYTISNDYSIAYMPFNNSQGDNTERQGVTEAQYRKAASFNTPGMLDRFYNNKINADYRAALGLYPLLDTGSTDFERASGFTNNYATAGGVAENTYGSIWSNFMSTAIDLTGEPYDPIELKERGTLSIQGLSGNTEYLSTIEEGTIFVVYGSIYTTMFTPDLS